MKKYQTRGKRMRTKYKRAKAKNKNQSHGPSVRKTKPKRQCGELGTANEKGMCCVTVQEWKNSKWSCTLSPPPLRSSATTVLPAFISNSGHTVIRKTIINRNMFVWKQEGTK